MSLIAVVVTLIVVGVLMWLLETYIPMDATIKRIIQVVIIICVVLWLLNVFGVLGAISNVKMPSLR
jgi:hypothetical protein